MYVAKSLIKGSFKYSFNHLERILRVEGEGNLELDIISNTIDSVIMDPQFDPEIGAIVDLKNTYYHPSYDELMAIKDHLYAVKDRTSRKIALVVNDDLYFVAIMICMFCQKFGMKMKAFRNPNKAKHWIIETTS